MEQAIQVKEIEALERLKQASSRFNGETKEAMANTERIHFRIQNRLHQEETIAQNHVNSLLQAVRRTFGNQSLIISNPGLESAQARLADIKKGRKEVGREILKYRSAACMMKRILDGEATKAISTLQRKIEELEKYIGVFIYRSDVEGGGHHGNAEAGIGEATAPMAQAQYPME